MRKIITLSIFLSVFLGYSQTKELDSLYIQLAFQKQDSLKVETSLHLIKLLYETNDQNRALQYINETENFLRVSITLKALPKPHFISH